jgi:hypothetical protein
MLDVLVETQRFSVPRDLLQNAGTFFVQRLNLSGNQLQLANVSAPTFQHFLDWMYTGSLLGFPLEQTAKPSTCFGKTTQAIEVTLFAEKIQNEEFLNKALERTWTAMRLECQFVRNEKLFHVLKWLVHAVWKVYDETNLIPLQRLAAMALAYCYLGDVVPTTPTLSTVHEQMAKYKDFATIHFQETRNLCKAMDEEWPALEQYLVKN